MDYKAKVMDSKDILRATSRLAHEISERNSGVEDVVILGIKNNGVPFAKMLKDNIFSFENVEVPVGEIDIINNRDDISDEEKQRRSTPSNIPCDLNNKTVVVVDDVLSTGRTTRAAIETVFSFGRPKKVQLLVLIDRGHRELPIRPDYIGKNIPTSKNEIVKVKFSSQDEEAGVFIYEK